MSAQPVFTEVDMLHEALAIAEKRKRELERKVHRMELAMSEVSEDAPEASEVRELLDLWWVEVMDSGPNVAHTLASTRAAKVRAAIRRRKKIDPEQGFAICRKAILGVREDDWAMGRVAKSGGKSWRDIADDILKSDGTIEKYAGLYDRRSDRQVKRFDAEVRRLSTVLPSWEDPVEAMLAAITSLGLSWKGSPNGSSWTAQCPAHEDRNPSLSFSWNGAGDKLLVKCWAGCEVADVMAALGLPLSVLFRRSAAA